MAQNEFEEAIKEAYASAPPQQTIIDTLSFYYPGLVDSETGDPTEIYVYDGLTYDRLSDEQVPFVTCKLEVFAERNGGQSVEFTGIPFEFKLPNVGQGQVGDSTLEVSNAEDTLSLFQMAIDQLLPITCTYRPFLFEVRDQGPQIAKPIKFRFSEVTANYTTLTGRLAPFRNTNLPFPNDRYDIERFPGLV